MLPYGTALSWPLRPRGGLVIMNMNLLLATHGGSWPVAAALAAAAVAQQKPQKLGRQPFGRASILAGVSGEGGRGGLPEATRVRGRPGAHTPDTARTPAFKGTLRLKAKHLPTVPIAAILHVVICTSTPPADFVSLFQVEQPYPAPGSCVPGKQAHKLRACFCSFLM